MVFQKTIAKEISFNGIGLHTGNRCNVILKPAEANVGVIFVRRDLPGSPKIKANFHSLVNPGDILRRTTLEQGKAQVQTIEHFMAALFGLGIDNLIVELDNKELPGLDGSSLKYLDIIMQSGIKELGVKRDIFELKEPIRIEEGGASIMALPSSGLSVSYTLDYNFVESRTEFLELKFSTPEVFIREIAPARTFCLESEAKELQSKGFGMGANYDNTLVLTKEGEVIKNKVRFSDEFVRHKILDLIGDLSLLGFTLKAHIVALKSGHTLNTRLVQEIAKQREKYFMDKKTGILEIEDIKKILPHREPFLFVDRIVSLEYGKHAIGIKNVTINDYFFKGHFPAQPVMPGVIIIEAMAQVGGVMMLASDENRGKLAFFMAINNVKFRKPVVPGDQLVLEVEALRVKSRTGQVRGRALVDGKVVAEAELMFALVED
jgi:UDP-3-O-[3-hydroxymyristoyl] N-acetylglucosamine deacetylase / 3-hydroxyacyl-[acyl-carrier-protein] dehydratase